MQAWRSALPSHRRGPRPGPAHTKEAILKATRRKLSTPGAHLTVRSIADSAEVDPKMIHYHFGTKDALLLAAIDLPPLSPGIVQAILSRDHSSIGTALAAQLLEWMNDDMGANCILSLFGSGLRQSTAAQTFLPRLYEELLLPIARAISPDVAAQRAHLVMSQFIGMAYLQLVQAIPPVPGADEVELTTSLGFVIDKLLLEPIH